MTSFSMAFFKRLWRRITPQRADLLGREQGQMIVRIAVVTLLLIFLVSANAPLDLAQGLPGWIIFLAGYLVFSLVMAVVTARSTRSPEYRRIVNNIGDTVTITYLMANTGEAGAALFLLYLWVTLGNGFRFGIKAMAISTGLSVTGFGVVIAVTDFWREHVMLAGGLLLALIVLPSYASFLIRQLHGARERAEEANAAKGQFLARMSHELRTPLNGIRGTTDLLRNSRRLTVEEHGLLNVIQESVEVSLRQIDSVLDFSRIEAGKLVLEHADFDLHELIHGTARMVAPAAREKNLRFLVRISPNAPYRLVGDSHYLREVLLNLLSNAIKFTPSGYVALQVDPIETGSERARLRFEIRDTGIGIAPQALERIWESFTQEDSGTTRHHGGTGLGTTIAKHLVELMGGHIAVSSIKGRGTVFWCELPFPLQTSAPRDEPVVSGARALLLSTDPEIIRNLNHTVEGIQRSLLIASSSKEALDILGRGIRLGNPAHLILVDERLAISGDGKRHLITEFVDRAVAAQTPLYLLGDTVYEMDQLCAWGYAGTVPRHPSATLLATAFRASPHFQTAPGGSQQIVRVEPWAWGQNSASRRRILVADDNRTNRLILEQILKTSGYAVDIASDGEEALEYLTSGRHRAAVLDLHMPGLDGINLLRRYRQLLPAGQRVPVVMLTADATFDARSDCAEAGADAFLTKPANTEALLATLDRLICEREVRVLPRSANTSERATEDTEPPVLDMSVLAELDRLCHDPARLAAVFEAFETEGKVLLSAINSAAAAHNHPAFAEWVHAMKGNAANVGALRLMRACRIAEAAGVLEFRRDGMALAQSLREHFFAAQQALQELAPSIINPETGPG